MYKKHIIIKNLLAICSLIAFIFFAKSDKDIFIYSFCINMIAISIYALSINRLISNKRLCESMLEEEDKKIIGKSKLGVIISYYKAGLSYSLYSVLLSSGAELVGRENEIGFTMNACSFVFMVSNIFISFLMLKFLLYFQLRRFE